MQPRTRRSHRRHRCATTHATVDHRRDASPRHTRESARYVTTLATRIGTIHPAGFPSAREGPLCGASPTGSPPSSTEHDARPTTSTSSPPPPKPSMTASQPHYANSAPDCESQASPTKKPPPTSRHDRCRHIAGVRQHHLDHRRRPLDVLRELPVSGARRTFDELRQRSTDVSVDGIVIHLASLDDIIDSKTHANRPKAHDALPELHHLRGQTSDP